MNDDREIMKRIQRGETELFALLAKKYRAKLSRFASSKLGDRTLAEDVAQDALVAAFSARDSYREEFAFSTWLWTIHLNLCRSAYRKERKRQSRETLTDRPPETVDRQRQKSGLAEALKKEQSELVHALLEELPEVQSDAIRFRFFAELSYEEIARAMECSLSGAKKRVRCGLEQLAALWSKAEQETD